MLSSSAAKKEGDMRVRKIRNVSESDVSVQINQHVTVHLNPNQELDDVEVCNLESIREFVNVEYDLGEIKPIDEKRQVLID